MARAYCIHHWPFVFNTNIVERVLLPTFDKSTAGEMTGFAHAMGLLHVIASDKNYHSTVKW